MLASLQRETSWVYKVNYEGFSAHASYFYQYLILKLAEILVRTVAVMKHRMYRRRVYHTSRQPDDNDSIRGCADTSTYLACQNKTGWTELDRYR